MDKKYFDYETIKDYVNPHMLPSAISKNMFLLDLNENIIYLSKNISLFLIKNGEKQPTNVNIEQFLLLFTKDSRQKFLYNLEQIKNNEQSSTDSHFTMYFNGNEIDVLIVMITLKNGTSVLGLCHINYELIYKHEYEMENIIKELEHTQTINQLILEGSIYFIYQFDIQKGTMTVSPKVLDYVSLKSNTFSNVIETLLEFIFPEDRHTFIASFTPFLNGKSKFHFVECRIKTKNGDIMWLQCKGKGIHDLSGKPLMLAGSMIDITDKKLMEEQLHKSMYYDSLTNLKNRRCLTHDLKNRINDDKCTKGSIICIDIQNFKVFNNIFGRDFANLILKEFVHILKLYFGNSLGIYRLEGDEFVLHVKQAEQEEILDYLVPFQMSLKRSRVIEGHTIHIPVRFGVAIYPQNGNNTEELIKNASYALRTNYKDNDNTSIFFHSEYADMLKKRYNIENELRKDISDGMKNFRLVYQPIIKYIDNEPIWYGAEALLRYKNEKFPDLSQMELIDILELKDLILTVGRWVLKTAIKECSRWHKMGFYSHINVNISAKQISDAGLLGYIKECCDNVKLDYHWLVCEFTETCMITNFTLANRFCNKLINLGIGVALDDFGTGYCSYHYLKSLPVTHIKVDREYIKQIETEKTHQIILKCLYDLSKVLNLNICAEGVELESTAKLLNGMGVPLVQGFYFDKPLETDIFRKKIIDNIKC